MYGTQTIEAKLEVPGIKVMALQTQCPSEIDQTFTDSSHLMALYLSPISLVECRYIESKAPEFAPLGSLFFRPASLHLHSRGAAGLKRAIHCKIEPSRFERAIGRTPRWDVSILQATLDLRPQLRFRTLMMRLLEELQFPSGASAAIIDAIVVVLINDIVGLPNSEKGNRDPTLPHRSRVLRIVRERVTDMWEVLPTVSELAELTNVCERHLLRVFKAHTGSSLVEFIRQSRAERAQQLVATTKFSLKEIAFRLGFSSHASFSTSFLRDFGISPIEFRREHIHLNRPPVGARPSEKIRTSRTRRPKSAT